MSPYELLIGLRYTRAKRRNHFISFISLISLLGITLGMTALITVMSVMNGFHKEVRTRILGVASHIQISSLNGILTDWQQVADIVIKHPQVMAAAPYVNAQGMLSHNQVVRGVIVRGILPEAENKVADFAQMMVMGELYQLNEGEFGIVIGLELARSLGTFPGDKIVLISPQGQVTPAGILPRLKQFTVVGVFEAGHYEYDSGLALIHMADAQKLYRMEPSQVSGVRLKLHDLFDAPTVVRDLSSMVSADHYLSDWTHQHANYFRAIQIEKRMLSLILALIIAVAAFNIVSTLVMAVTDKQSDIAILRTLGASPGSIMKIFIVQGTLIGVFGTVLGVIGGTLLAYNVSDVVVFIEQLFSVQFLSQEVYYISEIPSDPHLEDIVTVATVSFFLTLLATLYPSYRASKVNPAEALRYE
ncbi:MAG TPA: lipoprotein-releasing ABC transporter permease subunit [Nitrosomonas nitrosa]|uniref:Lipoprotein-releasing system permease protein n=1 Tax=Nitrosomonas nitrosa TaxID=52442 RepID=A0A1I4R115_9PROT|nr:lipoprotein-releasing ABC transporter permease subunit [Nitrosomonas nitrosa]MCO6434016.1 lipoprotein-releasing ABC transporter permease subunit [Nitrosomonas nitrosa]PTR00140.1 lipoprotein-releasing system permease protein [Nitrosomonas nitrosa]SFM45968.1 lipoprotein-releasing system permease protein [Nitrosomonas nitrosa]HBZ29912.1 lipoprotein-releasing ABC transporter permease subunit [Nitrosomonas nitrosa]HNP51563.1 lipoprotein-releasing ABC transporter permease subunit [Nitrosomonas ni